MSQTAMQQDQAATLPPAFRRSAVNPYKDKAEEFYKGLEAAEQRPLSDFLPPNAPQTPAEPAPQPEPTPQPELTPQPSVDYTPPQYNNDPALMMRIQQMEQDRAALIQQIEQQNQAIANLAESQRELDTIKAQQDIYANLDQQTFDSLSSLDPEDAKKLSAGLLNATSRSIAPLREELAQQRQLIEQRAQQQRQEMEVARIKALNARVLAAHPDFYQLANSKQYRDFMAQRDGLSSKTRDMRAAEEFAAGNVEYVIDMLNRIKGTTPPVANVQTVAPVQIATTAGVTPNAPAQPATMDSLEELNRQFSRRQITHDEYRRRLAALRAAK